MSQENLYRVREGVEWVDGAPVPADRLVKLSAEKARFDIEQGRIVPCKEVQAGGAEMIARGSRKGGHGKKGRSRAGN